MIPKINCFAKVFGPLGRRTDNEVIPATVLSDDEGIPQKTAPLSHSRSLSGDVIAGAGDPIPVCSVEKRDQPPMIATDFHLTAIVPCDPRLQTEGEVKSGLGFRL